MATTATEKVMIVEREIIKPSSPTPPNKRTLRLSVVDQIMIHNHVSLEFVYPSIVGPNGSSTEICQRLKSSLSKTLVQFYPFAGRVIENSHVDCDDSGVEFIEARIESRLADFFADPDCEILQIFLPTSAPEVDMSILLLVQATFFECGGLVIAVSFSHKIAEVATFSTFIKYWSAMAFGAHPNEELTPMFVGDSYFPQLDVTIPIPEFKIQQGSVCEAKRFVFDSINLEALKSKAAACENGDFSATKPTKFEAVSALIWKCAVRASKAKLEYSRPSIICFSAELRKRFVPRLPRTHAGNIMVVLSAKMHQDNSETTLLELINEIRKEVHNCSNELNRKEISIGHYILETYKQYFDSVTLDDVDFYTLSSWCNFNLYEADFGWGKPIYLGLAVPKGKNGVILMDTEDGKGIEALVSLEKDEMTLFSSDPELLEFAQMNLINLIS